MRASDLEAKLVVTRALLCFPPGVENLGTSCSAYCVPGRGTLCG